MMSIPFGLKLATGVVVAAGGVYAQSAPAQEVMGEHSAITVGFALLMAGGILALAKWAHSDRMGVEKRLDAFDSNDRRIIDMLATVNERFAERDRRYEEMRTEQHELARRLTEAIDELKQQKHR